MWMCFILLGDGLIRLLGSARLPAPSAQEQIDILVPGLVERLETVTAGD
jgi:hypothetical protein